MASATKGLKLFRKGGGDKSGHLIHTLNQCIPLRDSWGDVCAAGKASWVGSVILAGQQPNAAVAEILAAHCNDAPTKVPPHPHPPGAGAGGLMGR